MDQLERGSMELIRGGVNIYSTGDLSWSEENSLHPCHVCPAYNPCPDYYYSPPCTRPPWVAVPICK